MRAITYSSRAGFIRDLFEDLREIEVIFGHDVSVAGDIARRMAAQQQCGRPLRDALVIDENCTEVKANSFSGWVLADHA